MEWQLIPVGLVVVGAIWYLIRATWRSWQASKTGCGGGCGCRTKASTSVSVISVTEVTARLSSQKRPR